MNNHFDDFSDINLYGWNFIYFHSDGTPNEQSDSIPKL